MIFDKTCGNVTVTVTEVSPPVIHWATISNASGELRGLRMEDLRDIRHLIDRALAAAKHK